MLQGRTTDLRCRYPINAFRRLIWMQTSLYTNGQSTTCIGWLQCVYDKRNLLMSWKRSLDQLHAGSSVYGYGSVEMA